MALYELMRRGPASTSLSGPVAGALNDPSEHVQVLAVRVLISMGVKDAIPVGRLIRALDSRNRDLRRAAAYALVRLKLADQVPTPELIAAIDSDDMYVKGVMAHIVGNRGAQALEAVSTLAKVLSIPIPELEVAGYPSDREEVVTARESAAVAMLNIGPKDPSVVPDLIRQLDDPLAVVREASCRMLQPFADHASSFLPGLSELCNDPDQEVRKAATDTMKSLNARSRRLDLPGK